MRVRSGRHFPAGRGLSRPEHFPVAAAGAEQKPTTLALMPGKISPRGVPKPAFKGKETAGWHSDLYAFCGSGRVKAVGWGPSMAAGKYHGAAALRGKIIEQIKQVQQCRLFQTCRYLALIAMNQFDAWGRADEHVGRQAGQQPLFAEYVAGKCFGLIVGDQIQIVLTLIDQIWNDNFIAQTPFRRQFSKGLFGLVLLIHFLLEQSNSCCG